ncbi:helix-turn-helix transcriptional regulator [Comamonas aquatica]|uniref:helix-turn-helix transcriptional regulator n=1 Tax=Comamonas aquatica TaxID=225991 RepID=UPI00244D04E9|nr:AlpA family phage regulatory protein [Comamonas aquatica]MDH1675843.1 AlpA family phage regulatory protein [Comamonas aquatica]MDH1679485.1 AlpA family phage regulatory protein [Comamonas aquatica]
MKSKPEKGNAPEVAATEASSVKNQATKQGIDMTDSKARAVASTSVSEQASRAPVVNMFQSARPKAAASLLGVGVSTFWRWAKEREDFPKARKLSSSCTVFDVQELMAWRDAQAKQ